MAQLVVAAPMLATAVVTVETVAETFRQAVAAQVGIPALAALVGVLVAVGHPALAVAAVAAALGVL
jgi:hypothetical protein